MKNLGFKGLLINAHSLLSKMESLQLLVKAKDFDVICVVETWLSAEILDAEISSNVCDVTETGMVGELQFM